MTTAIAARSGAGLIAGAERTAGALTARLRRAWNDHRAYRRTLAELEGLTPRQLADAGLSREALDRTAFEAAYGK